MSYVIEQLSVAEVLSLPSKQIQNNILYAIKHDIFDDIKIYASHTVDLRKPEYFLDALKSSRRIFDFLMIVHPDFVFFTKEFWEYVQTTNKKTWLEMIHLFKTLGCKGFIPSLDLIFKNPLWNAFEDEEEVKTIIYNMLDFGSYIVSRRNIVQRLLGRMYNKYIDTLDMLIERKLLKNEDAIDYYVDSNGYDQFKQLYSTDDKVDFLISVYFKYKMITPFEGKVKKYAKNSKIYYALSDAIEVNQVKVIQVFFDAGYRLTYDHMIKVHRLEIFEHIIENYKETQFFNCIKKILYNIETRDWYFQDKIQKLNWLQSPALRWFFFSFNERLNHFLRFESIIKLRDLMLEERAKCIKETNHILTEELGLPQDVALYCIDPYIC